MKWNRRSFLRFGALSMTGGAFGFADLAIAAPPKKGATRAVRIPFSGLCALVKHDPDKIVDILMIKNSNTVHNPRLRVHKDFVLPGSAPPILDTSFPAMSTWDLTNTNVRILPGGVAATAGSVTINPPGIPAGTLCPVKPLGPRDWTDTGWLVDMEKVCGTSRIKPALVETSDLSNTQVASRIRLMEGTIKCGPPSKQEFHESVFRFDPPSTIPYQQAFTDTVHCSVEAPEGMIVIELTPFAGGDVQKIKIQPPANSRRPLLLSLTNKLELPKDHHIVGGDFSHFQVFYGLLDSPPAQQPQPTLTTNCAGGPLPKTPGDFPFYCPPAMFRQTPQP